MRLLTLLLMFLQFGPRPALTPAETLLEPAMLEVILEELNRDEPPGAPNIAPSTVIDGTTSSAGEIIVGGDLTDRAVLQTMRTLRSLIEAKRLPRPARTIRLVPRNGTPPPGARTAIILRGTGASDRTFYVTRNLWASASITDEVVELFVRRNSHVESAVMAVVETRWEALGIPTTTISYPGIGSGSAAYAAAASAYFLATLPNAGAEALLSHLTVGAHARLAEDGRKAVAQMGNQQRASADVLIMFGQAIEREQRRIRSFEGYMPSPVDPMVRSRIAEMEKGITSVWTSIGITSSPFVPAAERIRGRGGEDRRVPSKRTAGPLPTVELPTAFLKFQNVDVIVYELGNFIDGRRSISDIRDAVSAEFGALPLPSVVDYFERLSASSVITIK